MKVKQLIKLLQKVDPELKVISFSDYDRDYTKVTGVGLIDLDTEKVSDPYHSHIKYESRIKGKCITIDYGE